MHLHKLVLKCSTFTANIIIFNLFQGGQALHELHMNEYSITEILRLHLESSGAYRSDKSALWTYQQRGGYRLADDPGLQFRMDEPQILDALSSRTVYELTADEKMKLLNCLMLQILSFTTPRDEIDEKFNELQEAKSELRNHQVNSQLFFIFKSPTIFILFTKK